MKISLRTKLWLGFGGLLLLLLIVSAMSIVVLTKYSRVLEQLFRENYDSVVYCDAMKQAVDRLNARALTLAWPAPAGAISDAAEARANFETNLSLELNNATLPGELQASEQLANLWQAYRDRYGRFESLDPASRAAVYRDDLLPRYLQLKSLAQTIADMNMSRMVSVDARVKQTLLEVRNALLVLGAAGVLMGIVLVSVIGAAIRKPLHALSRAASEIGSGNLEVGDELLRLHSRDEIGRLAEAFNVMAQRLREFRRLDHDRLVRTQQTTQLAIDSLPDAVFVIGPTGTVEISNRMAHTHFNIRPGSTVAGAGLVWLSELYAEVTTARKPSEPRGYKDSLRLFDHGEERFLLPHAVPMLDGDERVIGVTVVLADVTRLRHDDELKNGLVSTVSHELRTPLTSIRMAVLLLIDEKCGPLVPRQKQLLSAARQDSDRLYGIIENLLNLSRIESGGTQFQFQPMRAEQIVGPAVESLRDGFAQSRIRLEQAPMSDSLEALADPTCVGLILTNLLSNAMKFTPVGGAVHVGAEEDGNFVAFTVADTGPGIPPEYACRIFDKFFRIPRRNSPTGAGLGLAIAKEIVEAHGGRIEFLPGAKGGSIFRFTLRRVAQTVLANPISI